SDRFALAQVRRRLHPRQGRAVQVHHAVGRVFIDPLVPPPDVDAVETILLPEVLPGKLTPSPAGEVVQAHEGPTTEVAARPAHADERFPGVVQRLQEALAWR